jgi:hypothetical protein
MNFALNGDAMRVLAGLATLLCLHAAQATDWVEVGADTQAKYYVDVDSIEVDRDTVRFLKRGLYTHVLTEDFGGQKTVFRETVGTVEVDCGRRINRVVKIEMVGENGEVVWSSGPMKQRIWEDVRPHTHAEATLDFVCARTRS